MKPKSRPGDVAKILKAGPEAKPCPFCQMNVVTVVWRHSSLQGMFFYQYMCDNTACDMLASTSPRATQEDALALWNYRGPEDTGEPKNLEDIPIDDCFTA